MEASYYRDFFARVWSADGHRYCNEPSHEDGTADEHHQRAAIAVSAGVLIHHFHAGLFGKSVQKTAVFRGDLHGSRVIFRTLWVQMLTAMVCDAGLISLHLSLPEISPVVGELAEAWLRRGNRPEL